MEEKAPKGTFSLLMVCLVFVDPWNGPVPYIAVSLRFCVRGAIDTNIGLTVLSELSLFVNVSWSNTATSHYTVRECGKGIQ